MDEKIIFKRDSSNIKKPYHLKNNVFCSMHREM